MHELCTIATPTGTTYTIRFGRQPATAMYSCDGRGRYSSQYSSAARRPHPPERAQPLPIFRVTPRCRNASDHSERYVYCRAERRQPHCRSRRVERLSAVVRSVADKTITLTLASDPRSLAAPSRIHYSPRTCRATAGANVVTVTFSTAAVYPTSVS